MTIADGLALTHLLITLFLAYKLGQLKSDVDTLYEGLAMTMERLNMVPEE